MGEFMSGVYEISREKKPWETGDISSKIVELIKKTPYIQEALLKIRKNLGEGDFRHLIGTAELILSASKEMGFSPEEEKILLVSALTHDVGKAGVDRNILLKPGKLSEEEKLAVEKHIKSGSDYLDGRGALEESKVVIRHHPGKEIQKKNQKYDRLGRFLAIADIVNSTNGKRTYHKDLSPEKLKEIRENELAKQLNPFSEEEKKMINLLLQEEDEERRKIEKKNRLYVQS